MSMLTRPYAAVVYVYKYMLFVRIYLKRQAQSLRVQICSLAEGLEHKSAFSHVCLQPR